MADIERRIYHIQRYVTDVPVGIAELRTERFRVKDEVKRGESVELATTGILRDDPRYMTVAIPLEGWTAAISQSNGRSYTRDLRRGIGFRGDYVRAERFLAYQTRRAFDRLFPVDRW